MEEKSRHGGYGGGGVGERGPGCGGRSIHPPTCHSDGADRPYRNRNLRGFIDYMTLLNQRDGGINGVKLVWESAKPSTSLTAGVECYERFKTKDGATVLSSYHTGVTYA